MKDKMLENKLILAGLFTNHLMRDYYITHCPGPTEGKSLHNVSFFSQKSLYIITYFAKAKNNKTNRKSRD